MTRNHLPGGADLERLGRSLFAETTYDGVGFGLGFAVAEDPVANKVLTGVGEYSWGGAASTAFLGGPERAVDGAVLHPAAALPARTRSAASSVSSSTSRWWTDVQHASSPWDPFGRPGRDHCGGPGPGARLMPVAVTARLPPPRCPSRRRCPWRDPSTSGPVSRFGRWSRCCTGRCPGTTRQRAAAPTGTVPASWWGYPSALPVIAAQPGWVEVRIAQRPNGTTAWLPQGDVSLTQTSYRIVIDLATTRLALYDYGRELLDAPAGVGTPNDPTPQGEFFLAFYAPPPGAGYGAFVLATSAHSNTITDWEGSGDAIIGIHGPIGADAAIGTTGAAISHGCVRLHDADLSVLGGLPAGTLTDVVPALPAGMGAALGQGSGAGQVLAWSSVQGSRVEGV